MEKNNKGLVTLLIMLVLLVIGLFVYIIIDKNNVIDKQENKIEENNQSQNQQENKVEQNQQDQNEQKEEMANVEEKSRLEKIVNVLDRQSYSVSGESIGLYTTLSLNPSEKLQVTLAILSDEDKFVEVSPVNKKINVSIVSDKYFKLFNEQVSHQNVESCPAYEYDSSNAVYYELHNCGGTTASGPISYINRYTTKGNEAYVYINKGFAVANYESSTYDIYTDLNKNKLYKNEALDKSLDKFSWDTAINSANYTEFSEYKITFVKNSDGYYFKSIEKVK